MTNYILFFISLYSILIACGTLLTIAWYFSSLKKKEHLKEMAESFFPMVGRSINAEGESGAEDAVEAQIDSRLDDIVAGFKKQIPMIGMFLSKSKEAELKETARVELMKLIPSIKQHFVGKVEDAGVGVKLEERIGLFLGRLWRQVRCRLFLAVVLVGFVLGVVEVVLLMLITG